jgi:hypothetical protein
MRKVYQINPDDNTNDGKLIFIFIYILFVDKTPLLGQYK